MTTFRKQNNSSKTQVMYDVILILPSIESTMSLTIMPEMETPERTGNQTTEGTNQVFCVPQGHDLVTDQWVI